MKYFTLRGPPKDFTFDGQYKNGTSAEMNGVAHLSFNNLSNGHEKDLMALTSTPSHYYYAQPRQKQRPQLAHQFNLQTSHSNGESFARNGNPGTDANFNAKCSQQGFIQKIIKRKR